MNKEVEETLSMQMQSLQSSLEYYYNAHKNQLSRDQMAAHLKSIVAGARYGKDGYFWINDFTPKMVMHPINPSLNGKYIGDLKDPNGKALFSEMVKVIRKSGAGFVPYQWNKPGYSKPQDKISYVVHFKPMNWIIGTGLYVDNVTESIQKEALATIASMRFGENDSGYFWIQDRDVKMVMHPINPDLNGKDMSQVKDGKGELFFQEIEKLMAKSGEGFISYVWSKPGKKEPQPKISFAKVYEPWGWVIGTGVYVDDIEENVAMMESETTKKVAGVIFQNMLLIVIVLGFVTLVNFTAIKTQIIRAINELRDRSVNLSGKEGDLTARLDESGSRELAEVAKAMNKFLDKIQSTISGAKSSANENASISAELSSTSLVIGRNSEDMARNIDSMFKNTETISKNILESVQVITKNQTELGSANKKLQDAHHRIDSFTQSIQLAAQTENNLAARLNQLDTDANQVKEVLTVIGDIADQTNLLALNAAIEAARAGEHGRGFAVVADEVRKLADRTQNSLSEINATINLIVQSIIEANEEINKNAKQIVRISDSSVEVQGEITTVSSLMETLNKESEVTISLAKEMEEKTALLRNEMKGISQQSSENARSVEEIAAAADHLNNMTGALNNKLETFKT